MPKTLASDFLIIGSGIGGLSLALKASEHGSVRLVTKRQLFESATGYAQGGLAAVFSKEDSLDAHVRDTLETGAGLSNESIVRKVVTEAPARVQDLMDWGVRFSPSRVTKNRRSSFELGLEGGHSQRRILHVGDYTGQAVEQVLVDRVRQNPRITLHEHHAAVDLLTRRRLGKPAARSRDVCGGAYVLDIEKGQVQTFLARATALATGGAGKIYLYTSNPDVATGDGMAMAYRAGARLGNMEFVQFHPTCLFHPKAKNFLISEALRGEGAILKNRSGKRFAKTYDPRGELAPRDIVARAIDAELKRTGDECVFLDITHRGPSFLHRRFPKIYAKCLSFGIDITTQPIPVVPAAHYFCGGVMTDAWGRTALDRLSAVGEVACTGLHGANRLASNSLPEALVFSHAVAETWAGMAQQEFPLYPADVPTWNTGRARNPDEQVIIRQVWEEIRRFMWNYVGIVRTTKRLERARSRITLLQKEIQEYYWNFLVTPDLLELRNIALVAELVIRAGLARQESRGLHHTLDFTLRDDLHWKKTVVLKSRWT
ncbi:MAG: L-aspartate oxidase [Elusimicrobia bacterium]|jgi:L-aspartate oxidase|nr:L-aspartate oxidase [Elusimicrobiota bacterium]